MDLSRNCVWKRRKGLYSQPRSLVAAPAFMLLGLLRSPPCRHSNWKCVEIGDAPLARFYQIISVQPSMCMLWWYYWHIINCPWCLYIHGQLLVFGYLEIIFMIQVFTLLFPARALFPSFRHVPDRNIRSKVRTDWSGYKYHRREGTNTSSDEARPKKVVWTWHDKENFPHLLCEHNSPFIEKIKSGEMFWSFLS